MSILSSGDPDDTDEIKDTYDPEDSFQSTLLRCKTMFTIAVRSLPTRDGSSQNETRRSIVGDFDIY
jgi:hypothetical protein